MKTQTVMTVSSCNRETNYIIDEDDKKTLELILTEVQREMIDYEGNLHPHNIKLSFQKQVMNVANDKKLLAQCIKKNKEDFQI